MLTNEMAAAATPPAKSRAFFRLGNRCAPFGSVSVLPRVHVEPDAASQPFILVHTSVAGKVVLMFGIKSILFRLKTGALRLHIGFSKITLFPG
jgi:hypothetical protein